MMGNNITHFFESLICWNIDTGIFYLSGRDIAWMIVGFLSCLVLWMALEGVKNNVRRRNEN